MGIGNSKTIPSIVDLLYKQNAISTDMFGICFGKNDGFMTIGGYNVTMHDEPVRWAEIHSQKYNFYSIKVNMLQVDYKDVGVSKEDFAVGYETGTIMDSGTSYTYLCEKAYSAMFREIEKYCKDEEKCHGNEVNVNGEPHTCYKYDVTIFPNISDFYQTFPVVSFQVDLELVDWRPEYYLFAWPEQPKSFCVGVYTNGGGGNVLGGNFMRGMDVIFDRTDKRIGFAHSSCDPLSIPSSTGPSQNNDITNLTKTEGDSHSGNIKTKEFWTLVVGVCILVGVVVILIIGFCCKKKMYEPQVDLDLDYSGN